MLCKTQCSERALKITALRLGDSPRQVSSTYLLNVTTRLPGSLQGRHAAVWRARTAPAADWQALGTRAWKNSVHTHGADHQSQTPERLGSRRPPQ